jgi:hypothetical protein
MLILDRRMLLRAGSAAVGPLHSPPPPPPADAPQVGKRTQPSFYRFKLGTIEITVVSDGTVSFPAETLLGDRAEDATGLLISTFQPPSPVGLQLNAILVNTGDKLTLIDAGCGVDKFQKTAGRLIRNLAAAGYAPSDIDTRTGHRAELMADADRGPARDYTPYRREVVADRSNAGRSPVKCRRSGRSRKPFLTKGAARRSATCHDRCADRTLTRIC